MLIKTNEFNQDINDMYFFRIVDKTIIINDNYSGVLILNDNFAILKTLKLLEGIVIYSSYINSINKEILLYCPDNEAIVYINLKNYMYKVLQLRKGVENLILINLFEWNENNILLYTNNLEFIKINITKETIEQVDCNNENIDPLSYRLLNFKKEHEVIKIFQDEQVAVIKDKGNLNIFNYNNQNSFVINKDESFIDIEYKEGIFALIKEESIKLVSNSCEKIIYPDNNYIFLKAGIINNSRSPSLVVMCSAKSNVNRCKLLNYKIT